MEEVILLLPDFVPIENAGMSVITAIVLFFLITGGIYFVKEFSKNGRERDKRLNNHSDIITEIKIDIADMKGDVKETRSVMDRFESSITDMLKANQSEISEMRKTYQAVILTNITPKKD